MYDPVVLMIGLKVSREVDQFIGIVSRAFAPDVNVWTGVKFTLKLPYWLKTVATTALIEQLIEKAFMWLMNNLKLSGIMNVWLEFLKTNRTSCETYNLNYFNMNVTNITKYINLWIKWADYKKYWFTAEILKILQFFIQWHLV